MPKRECDNQRLMILSKASLHSGMAVQSKCGCWGCKGCGLDLRDKWFDFIATIVPECAMWELAVCDSQQFAALTRRLLKAGKVYFRIRKAGVHHVLHQPLVKTRKYTPDPSKWLGSAAALAAFKDILYQPGVKRVSCSRSLVPFKPEKVVTGWKREAIRRGTVAEVNAFLGRVRIGTTIVNAKAFDERLLDVILLRDFPVCDPPNPNDPRISIESKAVTGAARQRETRIIDTPEPPQWRASDAVEPDWDEIRLAAMVI